MDYKLNRTEQNRTETRETISKSVLKQQSTIKTVKKEQLINCYAYKSGHVNRRQLEFCTVNKNAII